MITVSKMGGVDTAVESGEAKALIVPSLLAAKLVPTGAAALGKTVFLLITLDWQRCSRGAAHQ